MSDAKIIGVVISLVAVALVGGIVFVMRPDTPKQQAAHVAAAAPAVPSAALGGAQARQPVAEPPVRPAPPASIPQPPPPTPTPAVPQTPGKIVGNVLLTKNDGTSNLMRGLSLAVLPTKVSGATVAAQIADSPQTWGKIIGSTLEYLDDLKERSRQDEFSEKMITETEQQLAEYQVRLKKIERFLANVPKEMDAGEAHAMLLAASDDKISGFKPVKVIKKTRTNVEGKYSLDGLPPGNYYLYAYFDSRAMWIEWMQPVTVTPGGETSLDLFNDNAASIMNVGGE